MGLGVLVATLACIERSPLEGAPCPCLTGWTCCDGVCLDAAACAGSGEPLLFGYDPAWGQEDELASPHGGTMYFIAVDGHDAEDGRSEQAAWATFARANGAVQPGDIVYVRGGVYHETVVIGAGGGNPSQLACGTDQAPITWRSYPGEWAILDGSQSVPGSGNLVRFLGVRWSIFAGFELRNSDSSMVSAGLAVVQSSDNIFENLLLHHNHGSGQSGQEAVRNRFVRCTSHSNFDSPGGADADGFVLSSGSDNHYEGCLATSNSDDGFDFYLSTGNTLAGCAAHGNGHDGGVGFGFKLGHQAGGGGHRAVGCVAAQNRSSGFFADVQDGSGPNTLYNNTAFQNGGEDFRLQGVAHRSRNNLSFPGANVLIGAEADDAYCSWSDPPGVAVSPDDFVSIDPLLLQSTFLRLAPASAAVDAGADVGLPYHGLAPDLGAFERE